MEFAKTFEVYSYQTTVVSVAGDTALVSFTGHDKHTTEGDNATFGYSFVSTSVPWIWSGHFVNYQLGFLPVHKNVQQMTEHFVSSLFR